MMSSVNVNTNLLYRREVKNNVCYRLSRQMYNWRLTHGNSPLNVWGTAKRQHTVFTEVMDEILWCKNTSRRAVLLKINLCENKRNRTLVRLLSIFSNVFVWATKRRAMQRSSHQHSIYPIMAAGRYLAQSWLLSKRTMPNQKSNLKTCVVQNIP